MIVPILSNAGMLEFYSVGGCERASTAPTYRLWGKIVLAEYNAGQIIKDYRASILPFLQSQRHPV